MNSASEPKARSSLTSAFPASSRRPATTTFAPFLAKARAAARPMPVKPPVIKTTWVLIPRSFDRPPKTDGVTKRRVRRQALEIDDRRNRGSLRIGLFLIPKWNDVARAVHALATISPAGDKGRARRLKRRSSRGRVPWTMWPSGGKDRTGSEAGTGGNLLAPP